MKFYKKKRERGIGEEIISGTTGLTKTRVSVYKLIYVIPTTL